MRCHFRRLTTTIACLALVALGWQTPASAAPGTPSNLASTAVDGGMPRLSWDRVDGATSYEFQVAANSSFSSLVESSSTTNVSYVPTVGLPAAGAWRVRSKDASGVSDWAESTFDRVTPAPPALNHPIDGAVIQQPEDSPSLRWQGVAGATGYKVQIGTDSSFSDPTRQIEATTKVPSYLFSPTTAQEYWWRVAAEVGTGIYTSWSTVSSFRIPGLRSVDITGMSPQHSSPAEYVEDSVFGWEPVPGAVTYQLEVDTDNDFDSLLFQVTGVTGTRYARPATLVNDEYFWRVRGVDAFGIPSDWSQAAVATFRRAWPRQPHLEYPADGVTVDNPVYFEWAPIRLASHYRLELSQDQNFNTGVTSCTTVHTTYVPRTTDDCWPTSGGVWWWRVQGLDRAPGSSNTNAAVTDLISAQKRSFVYQSWSVDPGTMSPSDGHAGPPPTLSWGAVDGAAKYRVTYTKLSDGSTTTVTTASTSVSPRGNLKPKVSDSESYRWQVTPITESGRMGNPLLGAGQPSFTVTDSGYGAAASPEPVTPMGGTFTRFPTLTWTPMNGADAGSSTKPPKYTVLIRAAGAQSWTSLPGDTRQASYQDWEAAFLTPGTTYQWMVVSTPDGSGSPTQSSTFGSFTMAALNEVTGHRVSLRGGASGGQACAATLPVRCAALPETPILAWDTVPGAGSYQLTISYDQEHTNVFRRVRVDGTHYRAIDAFPDSQAGTAYYWYVQPCVAETSCRPLAHAQHAFEKKSNPVVSLPTSDTDSGIPGTQVGDDVTLSWQDYVASHDVETTTGVSSDARMEARAYRVQVATDELFATVIDSATVDQNQFTSATATYPEGNLWWRVQAIDGSGNSLPWSAPAKLEKRSQVPTLTYPADGEQRASGARFEWGPLAFAASYDVQVRKNGDTTESTNNQVVNTTTKHPALTLTTPLPRTGGTYVWRVRRTDAKGRKGAWSPWGSFAVDGAAPSFAAPSAHAVVAPNGGLFSWTPPANAGGVAAYRFERRRPGTTSLTESQVTVATAWAPKATLAAGAWEWRALALDTDGKELGSTGDVWRPFSVAAGPVALQAPIISGDGGSEPGQSPVGAVLTVQSPVWDLSEVVESWQWFRGSSAISGATSSSYQVAQADVGRELQVRVTGRKAGYAETVTTSNKINAVAGIRLEVLEAPRIAGSPAVGQTLTAVPGTWTETSSVTYKYQWLRAGSAIPGATSRSYRPTVTDVVKRLQVQVTASRSGYLSGTELSAPVTVRKLTATVTGSLIPRTVQRTKKAKVSVSLRVTGLSRPTGTIQVLRSGRVIKTAKLASSSYGRATLTLPKLKPGRHKLTVRYLGSSTVSSAKTGTLILKVTR
ncbi:Ig-like domain repeat protein [Nocardioides sp. Bht2]|uniref:Ig-like domain repeat protein n=1 Tax=Nocardioides sp. Bht2 TaxID=3392297 RepID=UPI0039B3ACA7